MKIRRDISSTPLRSGEGTWEAIVDLISGADSVDVDQLDAATSIMASVIADEHYADEPLTLAGTSHRLVIYLRYGAAALEGGTTVDGLDWNPTAGDWALFVPCEPETMAWAKEHLQERAPRLVLHELGSSPGENISSAQIAQKRMPLRIEWGGGSV